MIALSILGFYLMVGVILAAWAWDSYARKDYVDYGPRFNMIAFTLYALLWPICFSKDWRRFLNDTFGTHL